MKFSLMPPQRARCTRFISLNAGALALLDLHLTVRVSPGPNSEWSAGGGFLDLLFVELLNDIHGNSPSAAPLRRAHFWK